MKNTENALNRETHQKSGFTVLGNVPTQSLVIARKS